ncbi:MAG TPA: autotransporter-associated beta strand repeat-containing protein [Methylomirabilota bacterium]|nr:autotransporter-associated beta strand repeat-containing protein [Methylomirabilota bacterium]
MNKHLYRLVLRIGAFTLVFSAMLAPANLALWIGNPGVSANTNWSDNANWNNSAGGTLGYTNNDVLFGATGAALNAGDINSLIDTSGSTLSLAFTNGPGQFHTAFLPAGIVLTNTGTLTVGVSSTNNNNVTTVNVAGGGTLIQTGAAITVKNFNAANSEGLATLDLSGLSNFVYTAAGGTLTVAGSGSDARGSGVLTLAAVTNFITVGTINIATETGNGGNTGNAINLGAGTNVINVGTFNVVAGKINTAVVHFPGATGGLRLRGTGGTDADRANFVVANRNNSGSGTANGTLDFTGGHGVDIKAGTIALGQTAGTNPGSVQPYQANLRFDVGTIDCTALNMAACTLGNVNGVANLTISGGNLVVGASGIVLVNQTAGTATGNLNLNGGVTQVSGNIRKATLAGVGNLTISTGKLTMVGNTNSIGTPAIPIDTLNLTDSTMTVPVVSGAPSIAVTTLNVSGTSDTINISAVPGVATFPAQFPVISYAAFSGTYDFTLGPLPGNYQGYLSNNTGGLSIDLVITNSLSKSDTWSGNVNGNWDFGTLNWKSSGNPTNYQQGDTVTFDDTLTGTSSVSLTAGLTPTAILFNNSAANYVLSGTGKLSGTAALTKQGTGSVRLAETGGDDFSGGIIVSGGTLILDNSNSISGGLTINSGTVQVGNGDATGVLPGGAVTDNGALVFNRTDSFTVGTAISGTGTLTQNGTGTLALSGANGYTGNTTIAHGTLALTGSGTISNSAAVTVAFSATSAGLDVSTLTQQTVMQSLTVANANITLACNGGDWAPIAVGSLTTQSPTNFISVTSFPPIASYPVAFKAIQSTVPFGFQNFGVGNIPSGYAVGISQSPDGTTVLVIAIAGPIGARPSVQWTGADVPNLNTNWSDRLNWQLPGAPVAGDNVVFSTNGTVGASALSTPGGGASALLPENINNIADGDFSLSSLLYTNLGGGYHNTFINGGKNVSATNSGGLIVGAVDSGASAQQALVSISAGNGATLSVSNTNASVQVWVGSGSVGGSQATLDLSALNRFDATVSRLLVGATIGNVVNRPSGILYLARTNTITAAFQTTTIEAGTGTANAGIVVADCNQNAGSQSSLWLGQVNTIKSDTIAIGRQKANGRLLFNPLYANLAPYPVVTFQGFNSGQVSVFDVGDSVGNTGTTSLNADANLTGGTVNATIDIMNVGRASSGGTAGTTVGSFEFDAGTVSVNNLTIGVQPIAAKVGQGTVGVASNTVIGAAATLIVRGNLSLGQTPPGTATSTTSGTLNITNGAVFANNILAGTNSVSAINLYGGRLGLTNSAGTTDAPLGSLSLLPQGTSDSLSTTLQLTASATPAVTVGTLNLDGQGTTTNLINISSSLTTVGEFPLIKYGTMNLVNGSTFNIGLGTLPAGYSGYISNDTASAAVALVLTAAPHARPTTTSVSLQGGNLVFSGTNGYAGGNFYVLSSTNVALPLSNWTAIASGNFDLAGNFTFSAPVDPAKPQQYFVLQVP